jgi:hypothetical protein
MSTLDAAATLLRRTARRSDYRRWGDPQSLSSDWDSRTRQMAGLVRPGESVIEFGAGRRLLEQTLPAGCRYIPSDLVDRGGGTLVCDLNASDLPDFPRVDLAFFSGVIEYVNDVPRLLRHLSASVSGVVVSYGVLELNPKNRRRNGWVNDYSESELVGIFRQIGFERVAREQWRTQLCFRFDHARA